MNIKLVLFTATLALGACAGPAPRATLATAPQTAPDPFCLRETGSRLPVAPGKCLPVAGHSISRSDLESTGARNLGEALNRLLPMLR
jgi:hypothetical protein